eukprot:gene19415-21339_t
MNLGNDKELSDLLDFSAMFNNTTNSTASVQQQQRSNGATTGLSEAGPVSRTGTTMDENWVSYESRSFDSQSGGLFGDDESELLSSSRKALSTSNFTNVSAKSKDPFSAMLFPGSSQGIGSFQAGAEVGISSPDWRRYKSNSKNNGAIRSVYSPSPDDMLSQPGDPTLQYSSPKGAIPGGESYYIDHGSPDPWGHHITNNRTQQGQSVAGGYAGIQAEMQSSTQVQPSSPYMYTSMSPPVNGAVPTSRLGNAATSQTADALGKALASMYSTDTHSNPSYSSTPSTPVASPPPLISDRALTGPVSAAAASGNAWAPTAQTQSPPFDNLHTLSRMEERLDDAIWVLKSHAENPSMRGVAGLGYPSAAYPQGMTEALQSQPVVASETDIEATSNILSNSAIPQHDASSDATGESRKVKGEGKSRKRAAKSDTQSVDTFDDSGSVGDRLGSSDDGAPTEGKKVVREQERRFANNARERLRVRDINEAFKELGRMCSLHLKTEKPQTKLMVIHQAVSVIQSLEGQVRERNLNPKAACLKRREEEKIGEDTPEKRMQLGGMMEGSKRGNRRPQSKRGSFEGYPDSLDGSSGLMDTAVFTHS